MPSEGAEAFINGARMARELAAAEDNPAERARHIERAEDYEKRAAWMQARTGNCAVPTAACAVNGCKGQIHARGFCSPHYYRFKRHGSPTHGGTFRGEVSKFIEEASMTSDGTCLVWPFRRLPSGYGRVLDTYAHRMVCEIAHGPPPSSVHQAAHSCGNGHLGCVNHRHLSWKTPKQNQGDRVLHGTNLSGVNAPRAKLTVSDVAQIRELRGKLSNKDIAKMFSISRQRIDSIMRGESYVGVALILEAAE